MLKNYEKSYQGTIQLQTEKKAVGAVESFLEKHLPNFPGFLEKQNITPCNEDAISSVLEIYLQRQSRLAEECFMFQFQHPVKFKTNH